MTTQILIAGRVPPNVEAQLEASFRVHRFPDTQTERDAFLRDIGADIRGIATNAVQAPSVAVLDALPNLEIIASSGIGTDAIDVDYARRRGIRVANTPDVLSDDVADAAMMLMLAVSRQLLQADRNVREGRWLKGLPLGYRVNGKKLGILGLGRIGRALARRAEGFDMVIGYHQRRRNPDVAYEYYDDVTTLAAASDFLVVVVPGGPATEHMIDAAVLKALGSDGILVNVGRGSSVDEPALVDSLEQRLIRGAALDVFADEPRVSEALCALDNVVLAPHYASGTIETRLAMGQLVVDNLRAHFDGQPLLTPVD